MADAVSKGRQYLLGPRAQVLIRIRGPTCMQRALAPEFRYSVHLAADLWQDPTVQGNRNMPPLFDIDRTSHLHGGAALQAAGEALGIPRQTSLIGEEEGSGGICSMRLWKKPTRMWILYSAASCGNQSGQQAVHD
jgi:hypothetical protein